MREELSKNSLPVDNDLGKDLVSIMSNNNNEKVPPFIKITSDHNKDLIKMLFQN